MRGDGAFGGAIDLRVKDVDGLFRKYVERGLDTTGHEDSPVHRGPVNQTWSIREFYVTPMATRSALASPHRLLAHSRAPSAASGTVNPRTLSLTQK